MVLVAKLGYDRRALGAWTALAWTLCLISFFLLPPAGAHLPEPKTPLNVNYVFGLDDAKPVGADVPPGHHLATLMAALPVLFFIPTHLALRRVFRQSRSDRNTPFAAAPATSN